VEPKGAFFLHHAHTMFLALTHKAAYTNNVHAPRIYILFCSVRRELDDKNANNKVHDVWMDANLYGDICLLMRERVMLYILRTLHVRLVAVYCICVCRAVFLFVCQSCVLF
jgi:hypothetical protein